MPTKVTTEEVISAFIRTGGNIIQSARMLGVTEQTLRWRAKKYPEVGAALEGARRDSAEARLDAAQKQVDKVAETKFGAERFSRKKIEANLLENFGDIKKCADALGCHPVSLEKRVKSDPVLKQALLDGQEYLGQTLESRYIDVCLGTEKVSSSDASMLKNYLACKRGWTAKTKVEHSGHVYDVNTLPDEVGEVELPKLRMVENE